MSIVVVGSCNTDLVIRAPRFPQPGESIVGHSFASFPGGKGANQAVAAAKLGAATKFIGKVGKDAFGRSMRASIELGGIDCRHLLTSETEPSGVATITIDPSGQNAIVVALGANLALTPDECLKALAEGPLPSCLLVQLEIPLECVEACLDWARQHGVYGILNPAPAVPVPPAILKMADLLTPNEAETFELTGIRVANFDDARTAANRLDELGIRQSVLTLGKEGCLVSDQGKQFHIRAHSVEAVDTVGAGDAFNGALAFGFDLGWNLRRSCQFANAAAAVSVQTPGAIPSMPTRSQVDEYLQADAK